MIKSFIKLIYMSFNFEKRLFCVNIKQYSLGNSICLEAVNIKNKLFIYAGLEKHCIITNSHILIYTSNKTIPFDSVNIKTYFKYLKLYIQSINWHSSCYKL